MLVKGNIENSMKEITMEGSGHGRTSFKTEDDNWKMVYQTWLAVSIQGRIERKGDVCDLKHFRLGMPCSKSVMTVA